MPDNPDADNPFFLTRQIANLMEDFAREISQSPSIFLLYGDASVGKSRVLVELARRHFSGKVVHRIDFNTDQYRVGDSSESVSDNSSELANRIQQQVQNASEQEIIIIDHFESASNKARHQVFQSWVTDGLDKKFNIIIGADSTYFDEIRGLASQYQTSVKSFQLKPFNWDEIEAFASFYLFPDEPSSRLEIPTDMQKQLRHSRGLVGKLIEILSRDGVGAAIKLGDRPATLKKPLILVGALSALLLIITFFYPLSDRQDELPAQITEGIATKSPAVEREQATLVEEAPEQIESVAEIPVIAPVEEPVGIQSNEKKVEQAIGPVLENEPKPVVINRVEEAIEQVKSSTLDDRVKVDELAENSGQKLTGFQQELNNSLNWIENSDKNRATIQIMTTGFNSFADSTYYAYLDKLAQQDIDVSRIRIYQTNVGGVAVYSVVYGEYESRREASNSIQSLPDALKVARPIPRSMGSIQDEINNQG
ncbi:MAG: hypothetical protein ACC663_02790 [Gammaproteobacteria bacterium]